MCLLFVWFVPIFELKIKKQISSIHLICLRAILKKIGFQKMKKIRNIFYVFLFVNNIIIVKLQYNSRAKKGSNCLFGALVMASILCTTANHHSVWRQSMNKIVIVHSICQSIERLIIIIILEYLVFRFFLFDIIRLQTNKNEKMIANKFKSDDFYYYYL